MNFPWKKSKTLKSAMDLKTPNQLRVEIGLEPVTEVEVSNLSDKSKQTVEELFEELSEHEFVSSSPLDGSPLATIRMSDVYRVLCEYFNVDPKETEWRDYM